jgi:hypothetical protein
MALELQEFGAAAFEFGAVARARIHNGEPAFAVAVSSARAFAG